MGLFSGRSEASDQAHPTVWLDVDRGPDSESSSELAPNASRLVGRTNSSTSTIQLTQIGERALDDDDRARIETHLSQRVSPEPGALQVGAFARADDLLLNDEKISRAHAMFFFDHQGVSVVDLGSTNGTYVNGALVSASDLVDGDLVNLGRTRLCVRFTLGSKRSPSPKIPPDRC